MDVNLDCESGPVHACTRLRMTADSEMPCQQLGDSKVFAKLDRRHQDAARRYLLPELFL